MRDGSIHAVGTRQDIERALPPGTEVVDADGRIVLPGFVDAHTHPVFAGNRADEFEQRAAGATYQEIAARGGGIRATVDGRARLARRNCSKRGGTTATGFYAAAPPPSKPNRDTAFRSNRS